MSGGAGDSLAMASEKRGGVELGGGAQQASEGAKARASAADTARVGAMTLWLPRRTKA